MEKYNKKRVVAKNRKKSNRKKDNKGFTLIELLAVVVIMAVLLAIAFSAVSMYTTWSRVKTLVVTMDSYIGTVEQDIINGEYKFDERKNTIYAVPIECVSLEQGGDDMFGEWLQASESYWAYVLVQYDSEKANYTYGFTFKDSAGYGVYPIEIGQLNERRSKVKTGLKLRKPETGLYTNIAEKDNWTGFDIDDETMVIVLESTKEGEVGNGETTCTLCQKGNNYEEAIEEKNDKLMYNIVKNSVLSGKAEQYTGKGFNNYNKNVYFYNDPGTNNVLFADFCWKIVRTTDTGGVKLIYNGEPIDGTCDNIGSETQIGTSTFNEYSSALGDVGYMNGAAYEYSNKGGSGVYSTIVNSLYLNANTRYRYYSNISYSSGRYLLSGTSYLEYWKNSWNKRNGYYTCASTSSTCTTAYYIIQGVSQNTALVYKLSGGKLPDDFNSTIILAPDITINDDGTYSLKNYNEISLYDYYQNYANYKHYYACPDNISTTCDEIRYIRTVYQRSYEAAIIEAYLYGSSFEYKNGKYFIKDGEKSVSISMSELGNKHYTCFNLSGECEELYYIYNSQNGNFYYLPLENGMSIEDAKTSMLSSNSNDSFVKTMVDDWYADTMTDYTDRLEDTVYCNNRTISTQGGWNANDNDFSTHLKFYSFDNVDLTCDNKNDRFTVSSSIGNGQLTYPVGLITAPEAMMWGSSASGTEYWTMSAFGYGEAAAHNYQVFDDGHVDFDRVTYSNGVRPVISVKPGTLVSSGDGTIDLPYIIE